MEPCGQPSDPMALKVFFSDPTNSVQVIPARPQMSGKLILLDLQPQTRLYAQTYKTRVLRTYHQESDPNFECLQYTPNSTYNSCILDEIVAMFEAELGCSPTMFARDSRDWFDHVFNLTSAGDSRIKAIFWRVVDHYKSPGCPPPCTETVFETHLSYRRPQTSNDTISVYLERVG